MAQIWLNLMFSSFWQKNETAIKVATKMSILLKTKNIQIDSHNLKLSTSKVFTFILSWRCLFTQAD